MRGQDVLYLAIALVFTGGSTLAQTPAPKPPTPRAPAVEPAPQPPPAPTPAPSPEVRVTPEPRRQSVNVRVEVTITEQRGGAAPAKKIVSTVAGDGLMNRIRSSETFVSAPGVANIGDVPLNVDVMPSILSDGKIRLSLNLEYDLPGVQSAEYIQKRTIAKSSIRENIGIILESGKPLIVAQSADPVSDRQVTVEVRATILK